MPKQWLDTAALFFDFTDHLYVEKMDLNVFA